MPLGCVGTPAQTTRPGGRRGPPFELPRLASTGSVLRLRLDSFLPFSGSNMRVSGLSWTSWSSAQRQGLGVSHNPQGMC